MLWPFHDTPGPKSQSGRLLLSLAWTLHHTNAEYAKASTFKVRGVDTHGQSSLLFRMMHAGLVGKVPDTKGLWFLTDKGREWAAHLAEHVPKKKRSHYKRKGWRALQALSE